MKEVWQHPKTHVYFFKPTFTFSSDRSASGIILKPSNISGKRYADGKIQEALGEFLIAYASVEGAMDSYNKYAANLNTVHNSVTMTLGCEMSTYIGTTNNLNIISNAIKDINAFNHSVIGLEGARDITIQLYNALSKVFSKTTIDVAGAHITSEPLGAISTGIFQILYIAETAVITALKSAIEHREYKKAKAEQAIEKLKEELNLTNAKAAAYETLWSAWVDCYNAGYEVETAFREMIAAQQKVETVVAEAERILDERELARQQAVNEIAKERYKEMFFRLMRNNALTRYSTAFDLAQKYTYLTAQAYDYETGLMSTDKQSGEQFMGEIIGTRTLGEFDSSGKAMVTSGDGDGGLSDILARMDANWLVLKPRLGINNPQPYATWFSLRRELFRISAGESGDDAWKKELKKYWVDDLSKVKEFTYNCQPFHRDSASVMPEPGLVIPFSSDITFGRNFFGNKLTGGDASFDSSWYATHIKAAGVYFDGYNEPIGDYSGSLPLAKNPVAYLVPVGSDCMRLAGDEGSLISWNVVDQTIPAPFTIGSTELDDPDWVPLFTGYTAGNDAGARIRKHPSFRAYYGNVGSEPNDSYLDCTRLVGRSAWNTKWLLVIPAGAMDSDREKALGAFIEGFDADRNGTTDVSGVKDIRVGLKTYSKAGN